MFLPTSNKTQCGVAIHELRFRLWGVKTKRIVILGAGFAGINCARDLKNADAEVVVIDKKNHHLFQPLLYQVATATLSPAEIAAPIRSVLRGQKNTRVMLATVKGINVARKNLSVIASDREIALDYDYLVVATGARGSYFGHDEWEKYAPGLKSIPDATAIRQKVLLSFEAAETEVDAARRATLLHFILVGGGPTGVEMAGAIAELSHIALSRDFRTIKPSDVRITLIEAGPRLLATFPEDLSAAAKADLERLGVTVRLGTRVQNILEGQVVLTEGTLYAHTILWTAGVTASPAAIWLGAEADRGGRVKVNPFLQLPGYPEVLVLGDTACVLDEKGAPVPGVAPAAMQMGHYAAKSILAALAGKPPSRFRYFDKGNLATIGKSAAVADVGGMHLNGLIAWVTWLFVHVFYLIGFRNRVVVLIEWAWSYFFSQRGARLVTPSQDES